MKRGILITGLFLVSLLVLSGCEEFELAQNLNKYDDNCEEKAKELFPLMVPAVWNDFGTPYYDIKDFRWKDDSRANVPSFLYCYRGQETGENVNYCYMKDRTPEKEYLEYSKQVIDSGGNILGYNQFKVLFVLDTTDGVLGVAGSLEELNDIRVIPNKKFYPIIGYDLISCNWVEKEEIEDKPIVSNGNFDVYGGYKKLKSGMNEQDIIDLFGEPGTTHSLVCPTGSQKCKQASYPSEKNCWEDCPVLHLEFDANGVLWSAQTLDFKNERFSDTEFFCQIQGDYCK